jgi:hypothetical protein
MSETISYLQGGKLGDFIHSLCVCKYNWETTGKRADLYISNVGDNFEKELDFTYRDLKPILEKQIWLNSFSIYNNENIDVHLSSFRSSPIIYTTNWIEVYFKTFLNVDNPPKEYSWIDLEKDETLNDVVLISRSLKPMSQNLTNFYNDMIYQHDKCEFICFDEKQYENFTLKDKCPLLKVDNLYDFFKKINSCKLLISNQSGPAAWATAMNVPRIVELYMQVDNMHYIKDVEYYSNFKYFIGDVFR